MSNKYTKPVITIQHDQSARKKRGAWWLFLPLLLAAAGFGYFQWQSGNIPSINISGDTHANEQISNVDAVAENEVKEANAIDKLKNENRRLIAKLAKLERNNAIDQQASVTTQKGLVEKEKEIKKLEEELSFYKSIVSPENGETGLTIHSFKLTRGSADDKKQFHLVLTHIGGGGKEAKGTVIFRLQGQKDGADKILEWWDIRADNSQQMPSFKFKYYQRIKGLLQVPEGFTPDNILVKVIPENTKLNSAQQSYTWTTVIKEANNV